MARNTYSVNIAGQNPGHREKEAASPRLKSRHEPFPFATRRIWLVAGLIAGTVCSALLILAITSYFAFSNSTESNLVSRFQLHAGTIATQVQASLRAVESTLLVAAASMRALPSPLTRQQVYEVLSTSSSTPSSADDSSSRTTLGNLLFFEHLGQPTLKDRLQAYTTMYSLSFEDYPFRQLAGQTDQGVQVQPLNFSAPDIYSVTHHVHLPPTGNITIPQARAVSLFLNIYSDPSTRPYIDEMFETGNVTARPPRVVPAGYRTLTLLCPVYFRPWSEYDISYRTDNRGFVMLGIWNTTFLDKLDTDSRVTWSVVDVAADTKFVNTYSRRAPGQYTYESSSLTYVRQFSYFGRSYRVTVYPTQPFLEEEESSVPGIMLAVFLGSGVLFGFIVFWIALATRRHQVTKAQYHKEYHDSLMRESVRQAELEAHARVLGYVHHEVRNPLNVMVVATDLLRGHLKNINNQLRQTKGRKSQQHNGLYMSSDLAAIEHEIQACSREAENVTLATEQMEQHVNDMMDLQRLRKGELVLNPRVIDLSSIVHNAVRVFEPQARVPIVASIDISRVPDYDVISDETRISQVVMNALSNAIKFTEEGQVTVSATVSRKKESREHLSKIKEAQSKREQRQSDRVRASQSMEHGIDARNSSLPQATEPQDTVFPSDFPHAVGMPDESTGVLCIRIVDTGPGLRSLRSEELFKPFVAFSTLRQFDTQSSGLGLSICAFLAKSMNGGVTLYDSGNGCAFEFLIPVELRDRTSSVTSDKVGRATSSDSNAVLASKCGKPQRALVVDDDPTNVKLATRILKREGYDCDGISVGDIPRLVEQYLHASGTIQTRSTSISNTNAVETQAIHSGGAPYQKEFKNDIEDHPADAVPTEPYDVVFLDIRLGPTVSGVDIVRTLRERYHIPIPVIAMTANTSPSDVQVYKATGFSGLLGKPITRSKLNQLLEELQSSGEISLWLD